MRILLAYILCVFSIYSFSSSNNSFYQINRNGTDLLNHENSTIPNNSRDDSNITKTKIIAISLAITLGAFGVHRLYLGTKPMVPLAYTLTLGGGFLILPLIDIVYIILAKDLEDIKQNDFVFMWNKKRKSEKIKGN